MQTTYPVEDDATSGPPHAARAVIEPNSNIWVTMSRLRYYIIFFSEALGGQRACNRVRDTIDTAIRYRKGLPPTPTADSPATLNITTARIAGRSIGPGQF